MDIYYTFSVKLVSKEEAKLHAIEIKETSPLHVFASIILTTYGYKMLNSSAKYYIDDRMYISGRILNPPEDAATDNTELKELGLRMGQEFTFRYRSNRNLTFEIQVIGINSKREGSSFGSFWTL